MRSESPFFGDREAAVPTALAGSDNFEYRGMSGMEPPRFLGANSRCEQATERNLLGNCLAGERLQELGRTKKPDKVAHVSA